MTRRLWHRIAEARLIRGLLAMLGNEPKSKLYAGIDVAQPDAFCLVQTSGDGTERHPRRITNVQYLGHPA